MKRISSYFELEKHNTNFKTELVAGLTTFLSMAYILVVNPSLLSAGTDMSWGAVFTATAIAAIVGTLIMGLLANYPVALAPGMGMNAFFAFTICLPVTAGGFGYSWQLGLASIFVSGIIFLILSFSGIREAIINAIPQDLKYAVGAGIGLFIAFVGMQNADLIVGNPDTLVSIGDLSNPGVLLAIIGLVITVILYVLRVPAAIFFGILGTSIIGIIWGKILDVNGKLTEELAAIFPSIPDKIASLPDKPHMGAFIDGFKDANFGDLSFVLSFAVVIFSLLFIDFFDTAGTLVTVGARTGLINEEGQLEGSSKALLADASATIVGAAVGTSSTTSFIESLSGVEVGGRTGLTAVFTSLFFLLAIFFSPVLSVVTLPVTAPAMIFVGVLMSAQLKKIDWENLAIAIPAFLTILVMPLSYSIAEGIAVGFVFYPISMIAAKRGKEVSKIMYVLSIIFVIYFIIKP
jgi:adenine/guanine/hypoxanthine permease